MIEELYGKVSRDGTNLSDRLEDKLTGDFFGALRYVSFKNVVKIILRECIRKAIYKDDGLKDVMFDKIELEDDRWYDKEHIKFWPSYDVKVENGSKRTEPDLVIDLGECVVVVEVKYKSGLSSDDQLEREAEILGRDEFKNKKKILLYLAKAEECFYIRKARKIPKIVGGHFACICWEDVLDALKKIIRESQGIQNYEKVIIDDLIRLLQRKGFESFIKMCFDELQSLDIQKEAYFMYKQNGETVCYEEIAKKYADAAYVVAKTYDNVVKMIEDIIKESEIRGSEYKYCQKFEDGTKGIINDFWIVFKKDAENNVRYAINIYLTETRIDSAVNLIPPVLRVLKYKFKKAPEKNIKKILVQSFDNNVKVNSNEEYVIKNDIITIDNIDNSNEFAELESIKYREYNLMEATKKTIENYFKCFNELDK